MTKNVSIMSAVFTILVGLLVIFIQTGFPKSFFEKSLKKAPVEQDIMHRPLESKPADVEESQPLKTEIDETQEKHEGQQAPVSNRATNQNTMAETGGFACGPDTVCDRTTQYCYVLFGGPRGVPPSYTCVALPDRCPSPPTCECIPAGIGCECTKSDGGITVTCTAP